MNVVCVSALSVQREGLEGRTAMLISVISVSKCDRISTDFDAKLMQTTFHETEYVFWHS